MATVTQYRRPTANIQSKTSARPRRPFGQGIDAPTTRRNAPTGEGWFNPAEVEDRSDRLTWAELQALRGAKPVTSRPVQIEAPNTLAKFLRQVADQHAPHVMHPYCGWLAAKLREMADAADFHGATTGQDLDEREEIVVAAALARR
jgi:hypothetical protein